MRDMLGPDTVVGYCTNVHAGANYAQMLANLQRYTLRVKELVSPDAPMGVGLWLSARTARDLIDQRRVGELTAWLREHGLIAFTLNGFPHGDFHEAVVKHRVYEPTWVDPARSAYTRDLVTILVELLGDDEPEGGISTLPLGWRPRIAAEPGAVERAAANLVELADHLADVEARTGKLIHLDIEPEPGCALDTCDDVTAFFTEQLLSRGDEARVLRYLRVCHDVCHAAVMCQEQAEVLQRYAAAGIRVGKVQVSSAVQATFDELKDDGERRAALRQLQDFAEDRYLHQTMVRSGDGSPPRFFEDLPAALASCGRDVPRGQWRTHFHVPLHLERFGLLQTTMGETVKCLAAMRRYADVHHFEAETYAWNVLPAELRGDDLAEGIARELRWLCEHGQAQACARSDAQEHAT